MDTTITRLSSRVEHLTQEIDVLYSTIKKQSTRIEDLEIWVSSLSDAMDDLQLSGSRGYDYSPAVL